MVEREVLSAKISSELESRNRNIKWDLKLTALEKLFYRNDFIELELWLVNGRKKRIRLG